MILTKIGLVVLICFLHVFQDIAKHKKPFDENKKKFSWKSDWWYWRWDDMAKVVLIVLVIAPLAGEVGGLVVEKVAEVAGYTGDLSAKIAEGGLELTALAACAYFIPKRILKDD